jgi:hypothetical protein
MMQTFDGFHRIHLQTISPIRNRELASAWAFDRGKTGHRSPADRNILVRVVFTPEILWSAVRFSEGHFRSGGVQYFEGPHRH